MDEVLQRAARPHGEPGHGENDESAPHDGPDHVVFRLQGSAPRSQRPDGDDVPAVDGQGHRADGRQRGEQPA